MLDSQICYSCSPQTWFEVNRIQNSYGPRDLLGPVTSKIDEFNATISLSLSLALALSVCIYYKLYTSMETYNNNILTALNENISKEMPESCFIVVLLFQLTVNMC